MGSNDSVEGSRVILGGVWASSSSDLTSSFRLSGSPTNEGRGLGFRVAIIPEPSVVSLLLIAAVGLTMKRRFR